jgi:ubiquinone/menaquinone biosynthesis C-methylase UbiE
MATHRWHVHCMPVAPMNPSDTLDHLEPRGLRASPNFSFALMPDGRPYVAQEVEPYAQYWLNERERQVLAAFSGRRGDTVGRVVDRCLQADGAPPAGPRRRQLLRVVQSLEQAGVLADLRQDTSRYDASIVAPYLEHRPFPAEICARIVEQAGLHAGSHVLDLAGGPGDLALQLARHSPHVSLMDWSRGFLASARRRARQQGLELHTVHESCNRLIHDGGSYDVLTVSQALHWLDDVQVCRGAVRVLRSQGSFFVVHSAFDVPDRHPLAHVLGHDSVLGRKPRIGFAREVQALQDRLALLFRALDTPDVQRIDPTQRQTPLRRMGSAGVSLFRQHRTLGLGFLRALLTPRHLTSAGLDPAGFWADAEARCAAAGPDALAGTHDWALLHFRRGGKPAGAVRVARCPVQAIDCSAP